MPSTLARKRSATELPELERHLCTLERLFHERPDEPVNLFAYDKAHWQEYLEKHRGDIGEAALKKCQQRATNFIYELLLEQSDEAVKWLAVIMLNAKTLRERILIDVLGEDGRWQEYYEECGDIPRADIQYYYLAAHKFLHAMCEDFPLRDAAYFEQHICSTIQKTCKSAISDGPIAGSPMPLAPESLQEDMKPVKFILLPSGETVDKPTLKTPPPRAAAKKPSASAAPPENKPPESPPKEAYEQLVERLKAQRWIATADTPAKKAKSARECARYILALHEAHAGALPDPAIIKRLHDEFATASYYRLEMYFGEVIETWVEYAKELLS